MKRNMKSLTKPASAMLLIAAMLSLSGCIADEMETGSIGGAPKPRGGAQYPIVVQKGPQGIDINSRDGHLTPEQTDAITKLLYQAQSASSPSITISHPYGSGPGNQMAKEIAQFIAQQGVSHPHVRMETYPAKFGPVHVSFLGSVASVRPCGDWTRDMTDTVSNSSYPNLGCAVQTNIAAELATPENSVVPATSDMRQGYAPASATYRAQSYVNSVTIPSNYGYTP